MTFIFQFVNVVYYTDLWILKNPCIPGIKPTWSWCMIFLMCFFVCLFLKRTVYLLNLGQIRYTTNFKFTSFNSILKFLHTHTHTHKLACNSCPQVKLSYLKLLLVFSPKVEKLCTLNMKTCNKFNYTKLVTCSFPLAKIQKKCTSNQYTSVTT